MINTKFIPGFCSVCGSEKITFDKHYNLPQCFDFVLVCPNHPGQVFFDLPIEEMQEIANQESIYG